MRTAYLPYSDCFIITKVEPHNLLAVEALVLSKLQAWSGVAAKVLLKDVSTTAPFSQ